MDKKRILALAFCFGLLLVWFPAMEKLGWLPHRKARAVEPDPAAEPGVVEGEAPVVVSGEPPAAEDVASRDSAPLPPPSASTEEPGPVGALRVPEAGRVGPLLEIAVPEFVTLALHGGGAGIAAVRLDRYLAYAADEPVSIGHPARPYCALVLPEDQVNLGAGEVVAHTAYTLEVRRTDATGDLTVSERWWADPENPYRLGYDVTLTNTGDLPVELTNVAIAGGAMALEQATATAKVGRMGTIDLGVDVAVPGRSRPLSFSVKKIEKQKADQPDSLAQQELNWLAVHNKYFLFYLAPAEGTFAGCRVEVEVDDPVLAEPVAAGDDEPAGRKWVAAQAYVGPVNVPAGREVALLFNGYAGPKEYRRLREIGGNLEGVMRLDLFMFWRARWMGGISKTILTSLLWLQSKIDTGWGYGIAIIIVTVVIKTLFWPLTHYSTLSMRKVQKLQPLVQEVKKRYADDPQVMNRKVMELYRENKVNPMGGCLPIVLQIPVFFALFNTLRGAIELRQASFLWVADLSLPDTLPWMPFGLPLRPLAVLMGASMFIQQQLSPSTGDPSQKRMMTFMTVFFMFIFYGMPAGLTLYWTVNQVLTIAQSLITRRFEARSST